MDMKIGPIKPLHVFALLFIAAVFLAVWIPSQPSPDTSGKFHVSEAVTILYRIKREAEPFYEETGRMPDISELKNVGGYGEFVATVEGSNPYFVTLKTTDVYEHVAGKSIGWRFDPEHKTWDQCSLGTVPIRFKPLRCRE